MSRLQHVIPSDFRHQKKNILAFYGNGNNGKQSFFIYYWTLLYGTLMFHGNIAVKEKKIVLVEANYARGTRARAACNATKHMYLATGVPR
jgi:hypothetical protein